MLRNACKDTSLDIVARLHLLEIIELRSMKWVLTESVTNYYRQKLSMVDVSLFSCFCKLLFNYCSIRASFVKDEEL